MSFRPANAYVVPEVSVDVVVSEAVSVLGDGVAVKVTVNGGGV